MKKQTLIGLTSLLLLFASGTVTAQKSAKSVYFELGGAGLASFNYDMRFQKKEDGIGFKVGMGGYSIDGESAVFVPVGLNYLFTKNKRHYFEVGLGYTFATFSEDDYYDDDDMFSENFGHAFFGYRFQPKEGGFLFRAGLTPIFNSDVFIPYWAGVSFGYKF